MEPPRLRKFNDRLRYFMDEFNLTEDVLARKMAEFENDELFKKRYDRALQRIRGLVAGTTEPSMVSVQQVAKKLRCSPQWLAFGVGPMILDDDRESAQVSGGYQRKKKGFFQRLLDALMGR